MAASMPTLQEGFSKSGGCAVTDNSDLDIQGREAAKVSGGFFLHTDSPREGRAELP